MTTPIIRISQLPEESQSTISGNPANTWFAIVNSDIMKTKRISLETLLQFLAGFFYSESGELVSNFFTIQTEGGLLANNSNETVIYTGNTVILSDTVTYNLANSSYKHANSAFNHANSSFTRANLAQFIATSAFNHANGAFDKANSGISLYGPLQSDNINPSILYLGQSLYYTGYSSFDLTMTNGLLVNGLTSDTVNLGETISISPQPITINTSGGLTGGGQVGLNQQISLNANMVYNHANSAYSTANNCIRNPAINYITANGSIAYSNNRYLIIGDNITLTLQSSPKVNTYIYITNMSTSKHNIIGYNDRPIHGMLPFENLRLDVSNVSVILCYVDQTRGWVLV